MEELLQQLQELMGLSQERQLTKEEVGQATELLGELQTTTTEGDASLPEDFASMADELDSFAATIAQNPNTQEWAQEQVHNKKAGKISNAVQAGLGLLQGFSDLKISKDQIEQSDEGIDNLRRPAVPMTPQRSSLLARSIANSQRDALDASAELAPAQLGILDQYNKDIGNARTASTGQAGTFGALAQLASNRRARGAQSLAPIALQQKRQAQNRQDELIRQQQLETQRNFGNRMRQAQFMENRYNTDAQAFGQLGAAGRQNRRNAMLNLIPQVAGAVGQLGSKFGSIQQPTADIGVSSLTGFDPEVDAYASELNDVLSGRFGKTQY